VPSPVAMRLHGSGRARPGRRNLRLRRFPTLHLGCNLRRGAAAYVCVGFGQEGGEGSLGSGLRRLGLVTQLRFALVGPGQHWWHGDDRAGGVAKAVVAD
jgi:hypothetical protein